VGEEVLVFESWPNIAFRELIENRSYFFTM